MENPSLNTFSKRIFFSLVLTLPMFSWHCKSMRHGNEKGKLNAYIDTTDLNYESSFPVYRETPKRVNDIIHTKLDLKFDIPKAAVFGKATITFKPYFYSVTTIELNAIGFQINNIAGLGQLSGKDLKYN